MGGEALIAAIIIYTDKTAVTGDLRQQAWPITMTLANISKKRRGQQGGHVLMGTLPDVITNRSAKGYINDNVGVPRMHEAHRCKSEGGSKEVRRAHSDHIFGILLPNPNHGLRKCVVEFM